MFSKVLVVLCVASICRLAAAEPAQKASPSEHTVVSASRASRHSWSGDRLALLAHIGIGAPAGALGIDLDVAPIPVLALGFGAGVSLSGLQFAVIPRLRLASGSHTFLTLGSGVSVGRYVNQTSSAGLLCLFLCALEQNGEAPAKQTWQRAVWYNFELGADVYSGGRGLMRTTLGFGLILNEKAYECQEKSPSGYAPGEGCSRSSGHSLLLGSLAYGFDI